jgi:hypothetical protein
MGHWLTHLQQRKAGREARLFPDCWSLVWFGFDSAPDWAETLAGSGVPGTRWCPILTPGLTDLTDTEQHAWADQWLARASTQG